jgi:hypothetical protein
MTSIEKNLIPSLKNVHSIKSPPRPPPPKASDDSKPMRPPRLYHSTSQLLASNVLHQNSSPFLNTGSTDLQPASSSPQLLTDTYLITASELASKLALLLKTPQLTTKAPPAMSASQTCPVSSVVSEMASTISTILTAIQQIAHTAEEPAHKPFLARASAPLITDTLLSTASELASKLALLLKMPQLTTKAPPAMSASKTCPVSSVVSEMASTISTILTAIKQLAGTAEEPAHKPFLASGSAPLISDPLVSNGLLLSKSQQFTNVPLNIAPQLASTASQSTSMALPANTHLLHRSVLLQSTDASQVGLSPLSSKPSLLNKYQSPPTAPHVSDSLLKEILDKTNKRRQVLDSGLPDINPANTGITPSSPDLSPHVFESIFQVMNDEANNRRHYLGSFVPKNNPSNTINSLAPLSFEEVSKKLLPPPSDWCSASGDEQNSETENSDWDK